MGLANESVAETEALTLLLLGTGELHTALSDALQAAGQDVEHGDLSHALASVTAAAPDLVVLIVGSTDAEVSGVLDALAGDRNASVAPVVVIGPVELPNVAPNYRQGAVATLSAKLPVAKLAQRLLDIGNGVPERSGSSHGPVPNGQVGALLGGLSGQKRTGKLTVSDGAGKQSRSVMLKAGEPITEPAQEFVANAAALVESGGGRFKFEERTTARVDSVLPPPPAASMVAAPPPARAAVAAATPAAARSAAAFAATPAGALAANAPAAGAGPRVLVIDSDPGRATALAQALGQRGAQVRTLGARPADMDGLIEFDPQVVLVTARELSGACEISVGAIESHPRLRWASLLVTPDGMGSGQPGGPSLDGLFGKIERLVQPDRELALGAAGKAEFATRMELIGPVRTLRAIASAGVSSRVLIRHPRVSVELAFAPDGAVRARARARERGNEPMDGAAALATLFAIQSGRVQVRKAVSAPSGAEPLDVLLRAALAQAAPIRSSLVPPEEGAQVDTDELQEALGAAPLAAPPPLPATLNIQDLISAALQPGAPPAAPAAPEPASAEAPSVELDAEDPPTALSSGVQRVATPAELAVPVPPPSLFGTVPASVAEPADDPFVDVAVSVEPPPPIALEREARFSPPPPLPFAAPALGDVAVQSRGRQRALAAAAAVVVVVGVVIAWASGGDEPSAPTASPAATGGAPVPPAAPATSAPAGSAVAAPAPTARSQPVTAAPGRATAAALPAAAQAEPPTAVPSADDDEAADDEAPAADGPHARELQEAARYVAEAAKYRRLGRLGLAEAAYLRALAAFPRYPRAIAGVVHVHLQREDGSEAVRWAEQLVKMQPNRSNNQLLLGDAYALRGQRSAALAAWRLSAKYGNRVARQRLGEIP
jgi:hypothetical protein